MRTFHFTKTNGTWYICLPASSKAFNETDFTKVEEKGGVLDWLAHGRKHLQVSLDTKPMKNADYLELETITEDHDGFYQLHNRTGKLLKKQLGLFDFGLLIFGELPPRIYLRKKITAKSSV